MQISSTRETEKDHIILVRINQIYCRWLFLWQTLIRKDYDIPYKLSIASKAANSWTMVLPRRLNHMPKIQFRSVIYSFNENCAIHIYKMPSDHITMDCVAIQIDRSCASG